MDRKNHRGRRNLDWDNIVAEVDTAMYQHTFPYPLDVKKRIGHHWIDCDPNHPKNRHLPPVETGNSRLTSLVEVFDASRNDQVRIMRIIATLDSNMKPVSFLLED